MTKSVQAALWCAGVLMAAAACGNEPYAGPLALDSGALVEAADGPKFLMATLSGANEVPGPGDPDATGSAMIGLDRMEQKVCWILDWTDMAPPTAAHIHRGDATEAGPVVIPLSPMRRGCTSGVDRGLFREIRENPSEFYVNIHNAEYPDGAIRGQLMQ